MENYSITPKPMLRFLLSLVVLSSVAVSAFAGDDGFKPLFNGKDTTGWHVRRTDRESHWSVQDGILKNDLKPGEHGVDLITDAKY